MACTKFLSSLTVCNTSSFLTRQVQLIFSILLQHNITNIFRYFWSTFRSVQVSAPYNAIIQMQHFKIFFHTFKSRLLVKKVFFLLNSAFAVTILNLISLVHLAPFVIMLFNFLCEMILKKGYINNCFKESISTKTKTVELSRYRKWSRPRFGSWKRQKFFLSSKHPDRFCESKNWAVLF